MPASLEHLASFSTQGRHEQEPAVHLLDQRGFTEVGGIRSASSATSTTPPVGKTKMGADIFLAPSGKSVISDRDVLRIRGAAAILLHEEAVHGRCPNEEVP